MVCTQMSALLPVAGTIEIGQHDDRHFRMAFLEDFEQLDAAFIVKANIENDRVGFQTLNRIEGIATVAGLTGDSANSAATRSRIWRESSMINTCFMICSFSMASK